MVQVMTTPSAGPVKLFEFVKRPSGWSADDFRRQWVDRRLSLFAKSPDADRGVRRHELYQRLAADENRARADVEVPDTGYDAVSVMWFDDVAGYEATSAARSAEIGRASCRERV